MSIIIDKEFQALIPPLSAEEFEQLEKNCIKDGIRDALVVWPQEDGNDILIDGHNRWNISVKHSGIPFQIKRMEFLDRDAVIAWIADNQLGRRNLHVLDREALMAKKREALSKSAKRRMSDGGKGKEILPDHKAQTRDIIGKELGVSGRQVDKLHAINEKATPQTKQLVREGKLSINQAYNSVRPKRPDPVKQAKKEHEEYQEKKKNSIVDFEEAQIDKLNQTIIESALLQDVLTLLNKIDEFRLKYKAEDLATLFDNVPDDEKQLLVGRCETCKRIITTIMISMV